ncbi:MAG: hypothetical protein NTW14_05610 [bacterium]|nr:hypothetical protein [bacterium]
MVKDPFALSDNYGDIVKGKLEEVLSTAPSIVLAKVIRRVLENLVLTERLAAQSGVEIGGREKQQLMQKDYPDIQAEVDRAVGEFIGSIVSREGG